MQRVVGTGMQQVGVQIQRSVCKGAKQNGKILVKIQRVEVEGGSVKEN